MCWKQRRIEGLIKQLGFNQEITYVHFFIFKDKKLGCPSVSIITENKNSINDTINSIINA